MKFYSDVTKKLYDTEEELNAAELAVKKIAEKKERERKEQAQKEQEAKEAIVKDIKKLIDLRDQLADFYKKIDEFEENLDKYIQKFMEKYRNQPAVILATCTSLKNIHPDIPTIIERWKWNV